MAQKVRDDLPNERSKGECEHSRPTAEVEQPMGGVESAKLHHPANESSGVRRPSDEVVPGGSAVAAGFR